MTGISWTERVWNPVTGCDRVSPGCDNCYALTMARRLKAMGQAKYQQDGSQTTSGPGFGVACHEDALAVPLRWRKPRRVFVNSMSDLFHGAVPFDFLVRVLAVMAATPEHTYQVLTKRHGRMHAFLSDPDLPDLVEEAVAEFSHTSLDRWPLPNLHLGVSAEDQKRADQRIPILLDTPAAVRWISAEPLLGPVDLGQWLTYTCPRCAQASSWTDGRARRLGDETDEFWCQNCGEESLLEDCPGPGLGWVVCGGESGPKARPMHPRWARGLRDQCAEAGVPYLFKQWGEWAPEPWKLDREPGETDDQYKARSDTAGATHAFTGGFYRVDGRDVEGFQALDHKPWSCERDSSTPGGAVGMRRVGKKRAGRVLDDRTWDEYPEVAR